MSKKTSSKPVRKSPPSAAKRKAEGKAKPPAKSRAAEKKSVSPPKAKAPESGARAAAPQRPAVRPATSRNAVKVGSRPDAPTATFQPAAERNAAQTHASEKTGKVSSGLTARDLAHFRDLLLAKRRELVGDMRSLETEALQSGPAGNLSNLPDHMADQGTDNYEQEFSLGLIEKDRQLLREIDEALAKIDAGTYGICEATGKPIGKPRLEAKPWAKYCIEHARKLESRGMYRP